ncbi:hypothetical protein RCIP0014_00037 [Klebsiella phage RCIP0014]
MGNSECSKARRITRGQVRAVSLKILKEQGGVCALTKRPIDTAAARGSASSMVLDHDHLTGRIRGVLSRGANGAEGKVYNAVARWAGYGMQDKEGILQFLENMVAYLRKEPYDLLYYTHRSPEELAQAQKLKARKARARRKARETIK